ncbi:hypothetical protein AC1031_012979 [Aphanomyces cochlioides]|nr:hypothetical protein AC1031_012979 [Aphanomyces cochlioides]
MEEWEDIKTWFKQAPEWAPYAAASSAAALLVCLLCCICRATCCRRRRSNYEAITKNLEDEEREFEMSLSSDDDDGEGRAIEFNDDELKQMEMLESYGNNLQTQVTIDKVTPKANIEPMSPTAATTSHRIKKTLDDN